MGRNGQTPRESEQGKTSPHARVSGEDPTAQAGRGKDASRWAADKYLAALQMLMQASVFRRPSGRYGLAVVLVVLAVLARWPMARLWGSSSPYLTFYPAIMVAAIWCGVGPGLLATLLSAVAGSVLFVPPELRASRELVEAVRLGFMLAIGMGMSVIGGLARAGWMRAIEAAAAAERSLQKLSIRQAAIDASADMIVIANPQGAIEYVNPAFTRGTGYDADEAIGQNVRLLKSGVQDARFYETLWQTIAGGNIWRGELVNRCKNGSVYHEEMSITPVLAPDGSILRYVAIKRDITGRKEVESQAKWYQERLQSMAVELSLAEEREHRRLAGQLHDGVVQFIAAAKMRVSVLQSPDGGVDPAEQLAKIDQLLDRAERSARSLTAQLSPPALYDLGLAAAVDWLAEDMGHVYGLDVKLHQDMTGEPLDECIRIMLYQCLRELLINAAKHARTDQVHVRLSASGPCIRVSVEDCGVGFDPAAMDEHRQAGGFGLFSIRERIRHLGGRVIVRSAPGKGTTVLLEVPTTIPGEASAAKESS